MIALELYGLEVFGHHGAGEEERLRGQAYLYDLRLEVSDGALSDRLEDAVDYRLAAALVEEVSGSRQFRLIEALAAAVADAIVERLPVERASVRVRKPSPPGLAVEHSAATVERSRRP